MKILFCSVPFRPSIGGLETVSTILAERFHALGHDVVLVTRTAADGTDNEAFAVVRMPNAATLIKLLRWADVVFHNNISLRFGWPQLLVRRPWIIAHHAWGPRRGGGVVARQIKYWVCRFAHNIAVSRAMAESLSTPATIIPNPYAEDVFISMPGVPRDRDLVFLGRLVSGKGVPVLLDAIANLKSRGQHPNLTIIGTGPDETTLRQQVVTLGIGDQVNFAGQRQGQKLVALLNKHRVIVIPSTIEEPFGVVALEALACGCVPIVSQSGGLSDAVGPCGVVVPKNDSEALSQAIVKVLADEEKRTALLGRAAEHLANHTLSGCYRKCIPDPFLIAVQWPARRHDRLQAGGRQRCRPASVRAGG